MPLTEASVIAELPRQLGGALCLDFVNTVDPRHAQDRRDYLRDYGQLVMWSEASATITSAEADQLVRSASRHPSGAATTLARAAALRETLYGLLSPLADAPPGALITLNRELALGFGHRCLVGHKGGFQWQWRSRSDDLDRPLWPIAFSGSELLVDPPSLARVRECPGEDGCGWLFLDTSYNHQRRWCDMSVCGNRAKTRRHQERLAGRRR